MEHREPPRIAAADGRPPIRAEPRVAPPVRAVRRPSRRLAPGAGRLGLAVLCWSLGLVVVGRDARLESAVRWLHRAAASTSSTFARSSSIPRRPPGIAGGAAASSTGPAAAGRDEPTSRSSTSTSSELERDFRLYPLGQARSSSVERSARTGVVVRLDYREPVAWSELARAGAGPARRGRR